MNARLKGIFLMVDYSTVADVAIYTTSAGLAHEAAVWAKPSCTSGRVSRIGNCSVMRFIASFGELASAKKVNNYAINVFNAHFFVASCH